MKKFIVITLLILLPILSLGQDAGINRGLINRGLISGSYSPPSQLLKTGQTTVYAIGDDGDKLKGVIKAYVVNSTGSQSETVNVDSPHYAAATIAFAATTPGTITDSANLLATILTGDTIKVYNSTSRPTQARSCLSGHIWPTFSSRTVDHSSNQPQHYWNG